MKQFFILVFFSLLTTYAFAMELKVTALSQDGDLERSFVLTTSLPARVVLDCQSFIQGLYLGGDHLVLLDPEECQGLQERVYTSLINAESHCIEVDDELRSDASCH
jgi:hypothetical protein